MAGSGLTAGVDRRDEAGGMADEEDARRRLETLRGLVRAMPAAVTAYSGGVDSTLLAYVAHQELGERALAVTADSASLARSELADAQEFAARYGLRHQIVPTDELSDERYVRNAGDRCYFCKEALLNVLETITEVASGAQILLGVNTDDLGDHRPGQAAARERGSRFPMVEAGLSKAQVRWAARELGLPAWDKPAAACLSSRLAYGVPVTRAALSRIERAEETLRGLGFAGRIRVRDQGQDLARIEVHPDDLGQVIERRAAVVDGIKDAGFTYVTLDLEGYRQGSHNRSLPLIAVS